MKEVGGRVITSGSLSFYLVDPCVHLVTNGKASVPKISFVNSEALAQFKSACYVKFHIFLHKRADIPHLSASLPIKGRLVQHDFGWSSLID